MTTENVNYLRHHYGTILDEAVHKACDKMKLVPVFACRDANGKFGYIVTSKLFNRKYFLAAKKEIPHDKVISVNQQAILRADRIILYIQKDDSFLSCTSKEIEEKKLFINRRNGSPMVNFNADICRVIRDFMV